MKDFFISYNAHDRKWAEWIAWQLEEQQFTVIIQAWDFVGNWVVKMDQAMRETQRTIAVLSPNYLQALYTQSEWANAFRLDPTGEKDLLIPVRIAPVELEGILAQIVYLDLVDRTEDDARDLLIKRLRGERGRPAIQPMFPGGQAASNKAAQRSMPQRPPYPAAAEDKERYRRARDMIVRWRSQYADKINVLEAAGERARSWMYDPPAQFDDDVDHVMTLAGAAARDFRALPVSALEFARSYGLMIHPTVFWGQAINDALHQADLYAPEAREVRARFNKLRKEHGLKADDEVPDQYGFEMLARVLESAVALADFDIGKLPLGYLGSSGQAVSGDLQAYKNLLIAQVDSEPGLQLIALESDIKRIGSFAARPLRLLALCAQRNAEGSLDLVAQDAQHLYYWQTSSSHPTMQFPTEELFLNARFLPSTPGSAVIAIASNGAVLRITPEGGYEKLSELGEAQRLQAGRIWIDPLDKEDWYAIALMHDYTLRSGRHGQFSATRPSADLWQHPAFLAESNGKAFWNSYSFLRLATLDGLPCLIVQRQAPWGAGVHFLDPITLACIRRPLAIREFVGNLTIAAGRWLVVALHQRGQKLRNRIMVWDLRAADDEPLGGWFPEQGDIYYPIVLAEHKDSFQTVQVFRTFGLSSNNTDQLCLFDWPSGDVEVLQRFANLRIWPVTSE